MPKLPKFLQTYESWLLIALILLCVLLGAINPVFLSVRNLQDILTGNAFIAILSAGLVVVLISGGIDISFTATATVAQYLAFTAADSVGVGWLGVIVIVAGSGILLGAVNALLIAVLRIPSIIVTLATLNIYYGFLVFFSDGEYIYALPDWFRSDAIGFEFQGADGIYYALNFQIMAMVGVLVATWVLLERTTLGQRIRAFGGNPQAARRIGLPVIRIQMFVYCWMGICAGIASLVQAQLAQSVVPTALVGKELDVLAAVVLGGASLRGGVGSVGGTILGLGILAAIQGGMVIIGVSSYWSQFVSGCVLVLAICATTLRGRSGVRA